MAACIPLVAQRSLIPPSRSFESISSSRATTPTSSQSGSPVSSPPPAPVQSTPIVYGNTNKSNVRSYLPKSTLKTPPSSSEQLVNQILHYRVAFHKRGFWEEAAILERLYYKNKSQHRQAAHFQKLHECRRLVARIRDLNLAGIMDELARDFYSGKSLRIIQDLKWDSVPTRQSVAFVMTRIAGQILLLQKMQTALYKTYGDFYQLMSKTQFMAFALIAIGLCSRCSVLSKLWSQELVDCYKMLQGWIKNFPQGDRLQLKDIPDYEKELPVTIEDLFQTSVPDIPPIPDETITQQQPNQTASGIDDASVDLGEVIKRPVVIPKVKSTREPSRTSSPAQVPVEEDLVARDLQAPMRSPVISKNQEQDILNELSSVFSKPSKKSSKSSGMVTTVSAASAVESKAVEVKRSTDTLISDIVSNLDSKTDILGSKKKKKKKRPLDTETQSGSGAEESSGASMPATPSVESKASSRAPTPPTLDYPIGPSSPNPTSLGGSADESAPEKVKPKKPKASSLLSNFDDIFGGSSSPRNKSPSFGGDDGSGGTVIKKKQKVSQSTPKNAKDEIDDLFGSMTPKPKKPKMDVSAEIDSIFGPPKKKKKKVLK
ncbi:hypothetical protein BGZ73_006339 [Actinomortierella ambigua]|nr:hypothetical protein BGZ73_006339 [Actinomortierella ambigua]